MNKIIGLIGEDPNDTSSIKNLLLQKFDKNVSYIQLLRNVRGNQLDNNRTRVTLEIEYKRKKPDVVVFIRDADGLATHQTKIDKCKKWYSDLGKVVGCRKALLLNIWELEALIFADIDTFNRLYKTTINGGRNVTYIDDPKRELIQKTSKLRKKYSESDCPALFKDIDIDKVIKNCSYFSDFIEEFTKLIKN